VRLLSVAAALLALGCSDAPAPVTYKIAAAAPTNRAGKPTKLGLCSGCHGENGQATMPIYPNLAGQNTLYLAGALRAYQTGSRQNSAMQAMVGTLTESDIEALALYYSKQQSALSIDLKP
jgi:cytochrome c553